MDDIIKEITVKRAKARKELDTLKQNRQVGENGARHPIVDKLGC